jgi:hypothetical protein
MSGIGMLKTVAKTKIRENLSLDYTEMLFVSMTIIEAINEAYALGQMNPPTESVRLKCSNGGHDV